MKVLITLLLGLVVISIAASNWKRSLKAVFFIVVFEGALRKWVLPGASDIIYFLKDFVLLGAYLRFFVFSPKERKFALKLSTINILLTIAAAWCLFQAFNPSLGSVLTGILGLKFYLLYAPMMWLLPNLFDSEEELQNFLKWHLFLMIPIGLLGVVQYFSPATSWINVYAPGAVKEVATFGTLTSRAVRVTGTFSYVNSYQGYLIVIFALLLPMFSLKQTRWWRMATITEMILVVTNMLMNGSRTPVIAGILITIGYIIGRLIISPNSAILWISRFFPAASVGIVVIGLAFSSAVEKFWNRVSGTKDLTERIQGNFVSPLQVFQFKELDGYGTGATHPGVSALRNILQLPPGDPLPGYFEQEMGKVLVELGPIGFMLWYGLRASMILALALESWKLKRSFLSQLALVGCLVHLFLFPGQLVAHHTFSFYYWFMGGFIFMLPHLERVENWRQAHPEFMTPTYGSPSYFPGPSYR